ncbi:helix-turn-helix domain-containing protein [Thalassospira sp. UBA1131]|uniref:helix-turn-helix domain-containing protein n=1 Tax=Thalassospira sp. UBA1131 TaxID=1947672 RepID=UPI0025EC0EE9|nr:XRE family transcriptional regulator [Thalassospira sp. UBA1131]
MSGLHLHPDEEIEQKADAALGLTIRSFRQKNKLSLQQVAEQTNLSVGLLSQIERGISSPSIRVLRAICGVIKLPVHELFTDDMDYNARETRRIVRKQSRRHINFGSRGMIKEFLTAHDDGTLQVMEIFLEPGGGSGETPYEHEGEECGVILEGQMELFVDGTFHTLSEGDSFHFESVLAHKFRNPSDQKCRVLWVTSPPVW